VRVVVDREACHGHARCNAASPEIYELDDVGYVAIRTADVPAGLEDQARRGALDCPERAISIVSDDEPG
jgi:ferredoxin